METASNMIKNLIRLLKNVLALTPYSFTVLNYFWKYYSKKRQYSSGEEQNGFSILLVTYNRSTFLKYAIDAIASTTETPYELIVFDNASSDDTSKVVAEAINKYGKDHISYQYSAFNYGTNAYALAFLESKYSYIVVMDDDILALQDGWDEKVKKCFRDFKELGFLALDVIQDRYTNGSKPDADKYTLIRKGDSILAAQGPVGGWFGITKREIYFQGGGFVFRPDKAFRLHDADYYRKIKRKGYIGGILEKVYAYHASGQFWAVAGKYQKIWKEKYKPDYLSFVNLTDTVDLSEIPDFSVPRAAIQHAVGSK
jgi:glycosyltransferase involved in cell wall biosynthesis